MGIKDSLRFHQGPTTYGTSATRILMTIIRVILYQRAGPVWTSTLIQALSACGTQDRNARQTINRMADTGLIRSEKVGSRARWHLTDEVRRRLEFGRKRGTAFSGAQDDWDGQWLMVLFSVPESERDKRRRIRGRLEFAGFGFVQPGLAVSTHLDKEEFVNDALKEFGLVPGALVVRAMPGKILANEDIIKRAWDLQSLSGNYSMFIDEVNKLRPIDARQTFSAYVELERLWFYVALQDPELPSTHLPADWPGKSAKAIYEAARINWQDTALDWFDRIEADAAE